jgi:hypothetical protein
MRGKRRTIGRKLAYVMAGSVVAIGFAAAKPSVAGATPLNGTCSGGTLGSPSVLAAGTYAAVTVSGICLMDAGSVLAEDGLTVAPGASLVAAYGGSALLVVGNLVVQSGGTLIMGCDPGEPDAGCISGVGSADDEVTGNLVGSSALGIVVHASEIDGSVNVNRGGGGTAALACGFPGPGVFGSVLDLPVYTDFEDNLVGGSLSVTNLTTCWSGVLRNEVGLFALPHVAGITFSGNHDGDPDGNEVLNNDVLYSIVCKSNIPAVQFGDSGAAPNSYLYGPAVGQCAYPISEGAG